MLYTPAPPMTEPSITRGIRPEDVLTHMRVEDGLYVLGCLERRVTLHSQQIRALNLVYSLRERHIVKPGDEILVVGGGVAGLTAAAGAARLGLVVTLLERADELLHLQRNNKSRWIHPHIYDWPARESLTPDATIPVLGWKAALARDVVRQMLSTYEALPHDERTRIRVHLGAKLTGLGSGPLRRVTWHAKGANDARVSAVILAVGFGLEREIKGVNFVSYWDDDSLDRAPLKGHIKTLISGTGDGGLIDALRARLRDFQHDTIIDDLVGAPELQPVEDRLLAIEQEALAHELRKENAASDYLFEAYKGLSVDFAEVLSKTVDAKLRARLRGDVEVVLNGKGPTPFSLGASILNRFLISRLHFAFDLRYEPGEPGFKKLRAGVSEVRFKLGSPEVFHRVICRHGPESAIAKDFPDVWKSSGGKLKSLAALDQTRWPIYGNAFNRAPSDGSGDAGAGLAPSAPAPTPTPEHGPKASSKLTPLHEATAQVTPASEPKARPLQDGSIESIASDQPFSHWIPEYPTYVPRVGEEEKVEACLLAGQVVVITGMSGAGKSALCSAIARRLHADYDFTLWVDASEIVRVEQLGAVDALRNGQRQNVLGLLRLRRCLLVLDNVTASLSPDRLRQACGPGSRVLITSQHNDHADVTLGDVDETTARAILEANVESSCPASIFADIWRTVGGHPLVLGILNRLVRSPGENWTTAEQLCASVPRLEDPERQLVCDRILAAHAKTLRFELEFIRWCDSPRIDREMLTSVCGPTSERALANRNFLAADVPGIVRVHDLVFQSIGVVVQPPSPDRAQELTRLLADYLKRTSADERLKEQRVARVHHALFGRLLVSERGAALRYAYALPRAEATDLVLLGDPLVDARRLEQSGYNADVKMEVRAVIETVEAIFALTKRRSGVDAARKTMREMIPVFDHLGSIPRLPDELKRNILHHRAKALSVAGEVAKAEEEFRGLLAAHPALAASRLQLGRILSKNRQYDDAVAQGQEIFRLYRDEPGTVPPTVYLAAFELLRSAKPKQRVIAIIEEYKTELIRTLQLAARSGLDQPFLVVAKLGQELWYESQELFSEILGALPDRTTAPEDDEARFAWAQVQKFAAKTMLTRDRTKARSLLLAACVAYEGLEQPNAYQIVQHVECHMLLDDPSAALRLLESIEASQRDAFWQQRRAQACRALGDLSSARAAIDAALASPHAKKFDSAFLHLRWLIRRDNREADAIDDLRAAVNTCEPGRYRDSLIQELEEAEAKARC